MGVPCLSVIVAVALALRMLAASPLPQDAADRPCTVRKIVAVPTSLRPHEAQEAAAVQAWLDLVAPTLHARFDGLQ